jgi:hypothetical protein
MAIDDVYVLTLTQRVSAGTMQNSLAFIRTLAAEPTNANWQAVADAVKQIHRAPQSSSLTYVSWRARQVRGTDVTWPGGASCTPIGGRLFEGLITLDTIGSGLGDMLPPQCAMVTTLKTGLIGRRFRGRYYAGAWGEDTQTAGTFAATPLNTVTANWTSFVGIYGIPAPVAGFRLGVWSQRTASGCEPDPVTKRHTRVEPPNPAMAFAPIVETVTRPTVYTQRRRVSGVGM